MKLETKLELLSAKIWYLNVTGLPRAKAGTWWVALALATHLDFIPTLRASDLFPDVKGLHHSWCKILHSSSARLKSQWIRFLVAQGLPAIINVFPGARTIQVFPSIDKLLSWGIPGARLPECSLWSRGLFRGCFSCDMQTQWLEDHAFGIISGSWLRYSLVLHFVPLSP
jgi:hypothetical protein